MGSPLGPTMADFYMSHIENSTLEDSSKQSNPKFYRRYVDDILCIFKKKSHIRFFTSRLERASVLKFTNEVMQNETFNFLDLKLNIGLSGNITTDVYIKPTDSGSYSDFNSYIPESYKKSVIKTLVHRAIRYTSTWQEFNTEINRIKQTLANNSYPQSITENIIKNIVNKYITPTDPVSEGDSTQVFVRIHSLPNFTRNSVTLRKILHEHVKPSGQNRTIKPLFYFKPRKLLSFFSTRPIKSTSQQSRVVYQFTCSEGSCNATYLGYTTCTISNRARNHRYNSSIRKHYETDHDCMPPPHDTFVNQFSILEKYRSRTELRIAEALLIKQFNPIINVKFNEMSNFFNLYK